MPIPQHGRQGDLVVSAELLRDIPTCNAILAHGRHNDLVVGAEHLGGKPQCMSILLRGRQKDPPVMRLAGSKPT